MNSLSTQTFKGSYEKTQNGVPYYKTNTGAIIGGTLAGMGAVTSGINFYKKTYTNGAMSLGLAAASLLCGIGYDKLRNKKAQEFAEEMKNPNARDKNTGISTNGTPCYKSNIGLKYGAITGGAIYLGHSTACISNKKLWARECEWMIKEFGSAKSKPAYIGFSLLAGIPVGMIVGKIADYFSNKDAHKNS